MPEAVALGPIDHWLAQVLSPEQIEQSLTATERTQCAATRTTVDENESCRRLGLRLTCDHKTRMAPTENRPAPSACVKTVPEGGFDH
ncbi:hypothetical protein ACWIID_36145 [Streptomyces phaeochromogenes]